MKPNPVGVPQFVRFPRFIRFMGWGRPGPGAAAEECAGRRRHLAPNRGVVMISFGWDWRVTRTPRMTKDRTMARPLPVWATLLMLVALALVSDVGAAAPAQYEHDPAGRRVALKLPNGAKTTYAHDAAGRLTKVESKSAPGQTLYDESLTFDPVGNRLTRNRTQIAIVNGAAQTVTENTVYSY